ncbi:hypothetical protein THAOC_34159, partial [Thalassiosira oceanica]
ALSRPSCRRRSLLLTSSGLPVFLLSLAAAGCWLLALTCLAACFTARFRARDFVAPEPPETGSGAVSGLPVFRGAVSGLYTRDLGPSPVPAVGVVLLDACASASRVSACPNRSPPSLRVCAEHPSRPERVRPERARGWAGGVQAAGSAGSVLGRLHNIQRRPSTAHAVEWR